jgi:hypothetical protein
MSQTETHRKSPRDNDGPPRVYSAFDTSPEASSSRNKAAATADPSTQLQTFADERKYAATLLPPKTEGEAGATAFSSYSSSPYTSPKSAPRQRSGQATIIGHMEEITLPPIQAAVPTTRRGAVSGASSGPLMPFPPIRPPFEDDEFPSRGPSPTLGKRGSFSMGHSNHVPPGPDIQLPTPVLSGSSERRGGLMSIPGYINGGHSQFHGEGSDGPRGSVGPIRLLEEPPNHYQPIAQRPSMHWSPMKPPLPRSDTDELMAAPLSVFHSSSPQVNAPPPPPPHHRHNQFNDEPHRPFPHSRLPLQPFHPHPHQHQHPHPHPFETQHRSSSGNYQYDYHREGSAMSPGSSHSHSMMHADSSLSPRTKQEQFDQQDQNEMDTSTNGKRPRSAPRVMSTQPRIFACTQCPARFARNHDLKRHQRGHLSVRPYPCNWCEKSFSRKDALKRHILVKGCGKDGKGGGSGKGNGKAKRSRGESGDKRSSNKAESSVGDHDDGQYDVNDEQDDPISEENQQYHHKAAASHQNGRDEEAYHRHAEAERAQKFSAIKSEYRGSRYGDNLSPFKGSPFASRSSTMSDMAALHGRRPSASVA